MTKYYIIPAEIIDSNFPDDLEKVLESCGVLNTERTLSEVMDDLMKYQPKVPY